MNNIAILFTKGADFKTEKPFKSDKLNKAYGLFARKAKKFGLNVFIANYASYRNAVLKQAWNYSRGWKKAKEVEVEFVYSRFNRAVYNNHSKNKKAEKLKYQIINEIEMLNHPELEEFCWDKTLIKEFFPEHCPKTFLISSRRGLKSVLPELKTEKIILKPRYGTLGSEIVISDKKNFPKKIQKNTIVQEFIDSSHGIKGLVRGIHDLRLIIINGKLDHEHIRVPKNGNLLANMSKGGKKIFIKNSRIPKKALIIAKKVDKLLSNYYPRIYSIDFIFDKKQKPYNMASMIKKPTPKKKRSDE